MSTHQDPERLVAAAFAGDLAEVRRLVEAGADINATARIWNPLHAAIENMKSEVVHYLLKAGADPEFPCNGGRPIFHAIDIEIDTATQADEKEPPEPILTRLLADSGADINVVDDRGRSPIRTAIERSHIRAVELLQAYHQRAELAHAPERAQLS